MPAALRVVDGAEPAAPPRIAALGLRIRTFRNYASLDLELDGRCCVLTGPNGAGKTNLLEALSLLVPGRGLRRAALRDLPRSESDGGFAIHGVFATPDGPRSVGTALTPGA
ncbi:MAG: AAA family ATPase, partial [Pseudomonadota bacterium]